MSDKRSNYTKESKTLLKMLHIHFRKRFKNGSMQNDRCLNLFLHFYNSCCDVLKKNNKK